MNETISDWIDIAAVDDFLPGQSRLIKTENTSIAVFNLDGEFFAIEDFCTHENFPLLGCGMAPEQLIEGDQIICPRHGAHFCIRTGKALTAPAYEPIATFPVKIENNRVQIRVTT